MKHISRKLVALLLSALLLIGIMPAAFAAEESAPYVGTVSFDISADGFGVSSMALSLLHVSLGLDTEKKVADLNVGLFTKNIDLIVAWDNDNPRFTIPGSGAKVYALGEELVGSLFAGSKGESSTAVETVKKNGVGAYIAQKITETFGDLSKLGTTEASQGSYTFSLLNKTEEGRLVRIQLSEEQWKSAIAQLVNSLTENEAVLSAIAQVSGKSAAELTAEIPQLIESLTEKCKDRELTFFYSGENTLRAFCFGGAETALLYENEGSFATGRTDVIAMRSNGKVTKILENTVSDTKGGLSGSIRLLDLIRLGYSFEKSENGRVALDLSLSYQDKSLNIEALYEPGKVDIDVPGAADSVIMDMEGLKSTLTELLQKVTSVF